MWMKFIFNTQYSILWGKIFQIKTYGKDAVARYDFLSSKIKKNTLIIFIITYNYML